MAKKPKKYYFVNKERMRSRSKHISVLIEKMYDTYFEFLGILTVLKEDSFLDLSNHQDRAGITKKMLKKMGEGVEKYRSMFFDRMTDIFQTRIEDFTVGTPKEIKEIDNGGAVPK